MADHPSRDVLSAFVRGELPAKELRTIVPHLMRPCFECKGVLEMIRQDLEDSRSTAPELSPEEDAAYDAAISRAFKEARKVYRARQREQVEAARAAGILLQAKGLEAGCKLPRKMSGIARLEAFLVKSWSLRHENPSAMVQYAMMAVQQAQQLNPRQHGLAHVMDLRGRAYAELGNAYRVLDQHDLAEENLDHARQVLELGSGDEVLQIRLLELEASFWAAKRRFDLAALYLVRVANFYKDSENSHLAGRATISRGLYTGYSGDLSSAIALLNEGIALIDHERDPRLTYSALHNQLLFLVQAGQFSEAKIFKFRHTRVLSRDEGWTNEVRLRWIGGMIDAGLGKLASAEATFREVKEEFEQMGRPYVAAIVALDLAAVLLALKCPEEAKEVAFAAAKVFQALRIEREALGAVIALCTAFEVGKVDRGWVEDVADFLRRREQDPNAQFELRQR